MNCCQKQKRNESVTFAVLVVSHYKCCTIHPRGKRNTRQHVQQPIKFGICFIDYTLAYTKTYVFKFEVRDLPCLVAHQHRQEPRVPYYKNLFNCTVLQKNSYLLLYQRQTSMRITKSHNNETSYMLSKKAKLIVYYTFFTHKREYYLSNDNGSMK